MQEASSFVHYEELLTLIDLPIYGGMIEFERRLKEKSAGIRNDDFIAHSYRESPGVKRLMQIKYGEDYSAAFKLREALELTIEFANDGDMQAANQFAEEVLKYKEMLRNLFAKRTRAN